MTSLPERISEQARLRPNACALVWRDESVTYAALAEMTSGAARSDGFRATKSPIAVAHILAALLARRPVVVASPELPLATFTELVDAGRAAPPGTALMLTTSGSTGAPKLVPLPLAALDRFAGWAAAHFTIEPGTRVLSYAPLHFDLSLLDVWTTLAQGGCAVLVDPASALSGVRLARMIAGTGAEIVQGVPTLHRLLASAGQSFPSVRHAIVTGDAIATRELPELAVTFPRAHLHNVYGCTETNDSFIAELDPVAGSVPIGTPLPGVAAVIADRDGRALDGPARGELWVSTPFQTTGYLPASRAAGQFVGRSDGRTYFRTGDLVRRQLDGTVALEGRADNVVKVRGRRVNTELVEQAILAHAAVREAAVIAVPDALDGHRLHAAVRRDPAAALDGLILRRHCAGRLEPAAIPASIDITTSPLPRTATGKVDRRRCSPTKGTP